MNDYDVFDVASLFFTGRCDSAAWRAIALTLRDRQIDIGELLAIEFREYAALIKLDSSAARELVYRRLRDRG